jgi:hypothetical protein
LTAKVGSDQTPVTVKEITNYPFEESVTFEFSLPRAVAFPLQLRIPKWCREATVILNGETLQTEKSGQIVTINRIWKDHDKIVLQLPMEISTSSWGKNSRAIERGPLVYALKVGERWEKGTQEKEGDYFSVYPTEDWNYGIPSETIKNPKANLIVEIKPMPEKFLWNQESAPLEISAQARKIPNWKAVDGVAHQPVTDRTGVYKGEVGSEVSKIKLIPYGFTKVRIVAFPVIPD